MADRLTETADEMTPPLPGAFKSPFAGRGASLGGKWNRSGGMGMEKSLLVELDGEESVSSSSSCSSLKEEEETGNEDDDIHHNLDGKDKDKIVSNKLNETFAELQLKENTEHRTEAQSGGTAEDSMPRDDKSIEEDDDDDDDAAIVIRGAHSSKTSWQQRRRIIEDDDEDSDDSSEEGEIEHDESEHEQEENGSDDIAPPTFVKPPCRRRRIIDDDDDDDDVPEKGSNNNDDGEGKNEVLEKGTTHENDSDECGMERTPPSKWTLQRRRIIDDSCSDDDSEIGQVGYEREDEDDHEDEVDDACDETKEYNVDNTSLASRCSTATKVSVPIDTIMTAREAVTNDFASGSGTKELMEMNEGFSALAIHNNDCSSDVGDNNCGGGDGSTESSEDSIDDAVSHDNNDDDETVIAAKKDVSFQGSMDESSDEDEDEDSVGEQTSGKKLHKDDESFRFDSSEDDSDHDDIDSEDDCSGTDGGRETNNEDEECDNDDDSVITLEGCWTADDESDSHHNNGDLHLASSNDCIQWPRIRLPMALYKKLFPHQRVGVQWMASLHKNEIKGGILADDMGTCVVVSFVLKRKLWSFNNDITSGCHFFLHRNGENDANTGLPRLAYESANHLECSHRLPQIRRAILGTGGQLDS